MNHSQAQKNKPNQSQFLSAKIRSTVTPLSSTTYIEKPPSYISSKTGAVVISEFQKFINLVSLYALSVFTHQK